MKKLPKMINKKNIIHSAAALFILLLLFLIFEFGIEYSDLEEENARLNQNLSEAMAKANSIDEINRNVSATINKLEAFKQEVTDTTKWFKDNSNLTDLKEYGIDRSVFEERCLIFEKSTCRIKLSCPSLIFETVNQFSYKKDQETTNNTDYMQDLASFYRNKGGDCEDYSIAVSASVNYIEDYCRKFGAPNFIYEGAIKSTGTTYFMDKTESWFYHDASKYELPKDYIYHYTVCGDFPSDVDPNNKDNLNFSGHCVMAFTNVPITGSASIRDSLKGSILVEPQSGFFIYDLRTDDSMIVPYNGYAYYDMRRLIYSVITDDDYYIFKRYDGEAYWAGYRDFLPLIDSLEKSLSALKSGG